MNALTLDRLPNIAPSTSLDEASDKFSFYNLHSWCKKHFREHPKSRLEVHSHTNADGTKLYIGQVFDGDCSERRSDPPYLERSALTGSSLWSVLADGKKAKIWSFSFETVPAPDFWERYFVEGKCLLDDKHLFYGERWESKDGKRWESKEDARVCRWCGLEQVRETYVVERTRWVAVGFSSFPQRSP